MHVPYITRLPMPKVVENDKKAGSKYLNNNSSTTLSEILKKVQNLNPSKQR